MVQNQAFDGGTDDLKAWDGVVGAESQAGHHALASVGAGAGGAVCRNGRGHRVEGHRCNLERLLDEAR